MSLEIIITNDGSHSLINNDIKETYHSKHGAITESIHVFIKNGLLLINKQEIDILEVGFGTGLNCLLTHEFSIKNNLKINYYALEPNPINKKIYDNLNYHILRNYKKKIFLNLHDYNQKKGLKIDNSFTLFRMTETIQRLRIERRFDIIYFDAFAPEKDPLMWHKNIFYKCYELLKKGGTLVTYCAKGSFKRMLTSTNFHVETLQGPPGKREMVRAIRK